VPGYTIMGKTGLYQVSVALRIRSHLELQSLQAHYGKGADRFQMKAFGLVTRQLGLLSDPASTCHVLDKSTRPCRTSSLLASPCMEFDCFAQISAMYNSRDERLTAAIRDLPLRKALSRSEGSFYRQELDSPGRSTTTFAGAYRKNFLVWRSMVHAELL